MSQQVEQCQAPERLVTERLTLRRPRATDAAAILQSYAGDPDVTSLLAWPRHRSIEDTLAFVEWSDQVWRNTLAGPYLILDREDRVVGTTGLDVETPWRAATGYVLRRDAWGCGVATEVAVAMTGLAEDLGLDRLYALCHPDNIASARVLGKAGFIREGVLRRHTYFPNLGVEGPQDVEIWARVTLAPCAANASIIF
jgi:RimJ/RimL family protein N-acetyltransferase